MVVALDGQATCTVVPTASQVARLRHGLVEFFPIFPCA
jgi:hypothetical protein